MVIDAGYVAGKTKHRSQHLDYGFCQQRWDLEGQESSLLDFQSYIVNGLDILEDLAQII